MLRLIFACLLSLMLVSCEDMGQLPPRQLVVEGWFDSDGYPEVLLSMSVVPDGQQVDLSEIVVRWASVSITDETEGKTVMLTGAPSADYLPPYHYYSYEMKGVAGHTYTLRAKYYEMLAEATVTMPPSVAGYDLSVEQAGVDGSPDYRSMNLKFISPHDCPAYYHVSTKVRGLDKRYYPGTLGTAEANTAGEEISIPVMRGKTSTDTLDFVPYIPVGDTVDIKLERVDKRVYDFWRDFNNASLLGGSQFVSTPVSLPGNVGGALGIWSPQSTHFLTVVAR